MFLREKSIRQCEVALTKAITAKPTVRSLLDQTSTALPCPLVSRQHAPKDDPADTVDSWVRGKGRHARELIVDHGDDGC